MASTVAARRACKTPRDRCRCCVDVGGRGRSWHGRDAGTWTERLSTNKSLKVAPIADLAPPARTQIESFDVLSGPVNERTQTFTLKVRIGSTCSGIDIKGASVYVTAVPYNQFTIPDEELTGDDGTATLVFRRDANFPASDQQQQLTLFIRATKPGEDPLAGVSTGGLSRFPRRLTAIPCCTAAPSDLAARPSHLGTAHRAAAGSGLTSPRPRPEADADRRGEAAAARAKLDAAYAKRYGQEVATAKGGEDG